MAGFFRTLRRRVLDGARRLPFARARFAAIIFAVARFCAAVRRRFATGFLLVGLPRRVAGLRRAFALRVVLRFRVGFTSNSRWAIGLPQ